MALYRYNARDRENRSIKALKKLEVKQTGKSSVRRRPVLLFFEK